MNYDSLCTPNRRQRGGDTQAHTLLCVNELWAQNQITGSTKKSSSLSFLPGVQNVKLHAELPDTFPSEWQQGNASVLSHSMHQHQPDSHLHTHECMCLHTLRAHSTSATAAWAPTLQNKYGSLLERAHTFKHSTCILLRLRGIFWQHIRADRSQSRKLSTLKTSYNCFSIIYYLLFKLLGTSVVLQLIVNLKNSPRSFQLLSQTTKINS